MSKKELDEELFFLCKKCGYKFGGFYEHEKCDKCGGEFFTMPDEQYEQELKAELDTIYRHDELTNTLRSINDLPKLVEILNKHNIPHEFVRSEVLRVIEEQDEMCAGLAELRRKREKRQRPKLVEILNKHNIPHEFVRSEVLRVIEEQDEMCAGLAELRRKREKRQRANGIKSGMNISCPYCKSSNVRKINFTERMIDLGGKKLGKQWHCMSCGSDF